MKFDLPYTFWRLDGAQWNKISEHTTLILAKAAGGRFARGTPNPEKLRVTCSDGNGGVDIWRADYTPGAGIEWNKQPRGGML